MLGLQLGLQRSMKRNPDLWPFMMVKSNYWYFCRYLSHLKFTKRCLKSPPPLYCSRFLPQGEDFIFLSTSNLIIL